MPRSGAENRGAYVKDAIRSRLNKNYGKTEFFAVAQDCWIAAGMRSAALREPLCGRSAPDSCCRAADRGRGVLCRNSLPPSAMHQNCGDREAAVGFLCSRVHSGACCRDEGSSRKAVDVALE